MDIRSKQQASKREMLHQNETVSMKDSMEGKKTGLNYCFQEFANNSTTVISKEKIGIYFEARLLSKE